MDYSRMISNSRQTACAVVYILYVMLHCTLTLIGRDDDVEKEEEEGHFRDWSPAANATYCNNNYYYYCHRESMRSVTMRHYL